MNCEALHWDTQLLNHRLLQLCNFFRLHCCCCCCQTNALGREDILLSSTWNETKITFGVDHNHKREFQSLIKLIPTQQLVTQIYVVRFDSVTPPPIPQFSSIWSWNFVEFSSPISCRLGLNKTKVWQGMEDIYLQQGATKNNVLGNWKEAIYWGVDISVTCVPWLMR